MLFETPHFSVKNLKHLMGLTEGNPIRTSLYGEKGKEDVLGGRNSEIVTHQFKGPHKGVRIGVNLRRRQFGPTEHLPLKIRKREPETHVFENHFIHGKNVIFPQPRRDKRDSLVVRHGNLKEQGKK